ncbi:hypothetical protein B7486_59925, partial [cyanobacterium TDX16]
MPEHDVATLLRASVDPPQHDVDVAGLKVRVRHRRTRRRATIGALAALVVVTLGAGVLALDRNVRDEQVTIGPATTITTAPPAGQLVRIGDYALDGVPEGMAITGGSDEGSSSGATSSVLTLESDVVGDLRLIVTPDPIDVAPPTLGIDQERPAVVQLRLDGEDAEEVEATIRSSLDASEPIELVVPLDVEHAAVVELASGIDDGTVVRTAQELLDHLRTAPDE